MWACVRPCSSARVMCLIHVPASASRTDTSVTAQPCSTGFFYLGWHHKPHASSSSSSSRVASIWRISWAAGLAAVAVAAVVTKNFRRQLCFRQRSSVPCVRSVCQGCCSYKLHTQLSRALLDGLIARQRLKGDIFRRPVRSRWYRRHTQPRRPSSLEVRAANGQQPTSFLECNTSESHT